MELIIKTLMGLEEVLMDEIKELGYDGATKITRGARLDVASNEDVYKLNFHLRTALKILKVIHTGQVRSPDDLYALSRKIRWYEIFELNQTFALDSVAYSELFNNTMFVSQVVKDGIVDQFRSKYRRRPYINKREPDVPINVHVSGKDVTISLDSSGDPLFKRGYRKQTGVAPISEVLAAGLVLLSGWKGDIDFLDPMCGSGTIPIEAFMIASKTPPQIRRRKFAFMNWLGFDAGVWMRIKRDWEEQDLGKIKVRGSDVEDSAIRRSRHNFDQLDLDGRIAWSERDFFEKTTTENRPCCIITNPPYDLRMTEEDIVQFYKEIGDALKQGYNGSTAWIISGHLEAIKHVGLKTSRKLHLMNGAIESKFHNFEIF